MTAHSRRRRSPSDAPDNLSPQARRLVAACAEFLKLAPHTRFQPFGEIGGNSKHPLARGGYATATNDLAAIERWAANPKTTGFGAYLDPRDGLIVADLDLDRAKDKDGAVQLEALAQLHGDLFPQSGFVRSPSGGGHLYLRVPRGTVIASSNDRSGAGIDIRGNDGAFWFAIPGSITKRGSYVWERGPDKISDAPQWFTDWARDRGPRQRPKDAGADQRLIGEDLPENVAKAKHWLAHTARPAIEGQGGDQTTYDAAAMLHSFGLSEATALDLMLEVYNPRCVPEWEADGIELKVRNAYAYHTSAFGNCTDAYRAAKLKQLFKPIEAPTPQGRVVEAGSFRFIDRFAMEGIKPPQMVLGDLTPEGAHCIIAAPRNSFKSFWALELVLPEALNDDVLAIIGEGRPSYIKRVAAWELHRNGGKKVPGFIMADPVPTVAAGEALWDAFIDGALSMRPNGYRFAVVDTLGRSMAGVNENAQEHASKYTALVDKLQRRLGCTVLTLAHTGHGADDRVRGSTVFEADADTVIVMQRQGKAMTATLTMTKQKDAPEWPEPRTIACQEVLLPDGSKSLVVVKPTVEQERVAKAATVERAETPAERDHTALYVLKALRNMRGKTWSNRELATEARALGCNASLKTLQNALGQRDGKSGWARTHRFLRDYYHAPSEQWLSAGQSRLREVPPLPPDVDLDAMTVTVARAVPFTAIAAE